MCTQSLRERSVPQLVVSQLSRIDIVPLQSPPKHRDHFFTPVNRFAQIHRRLSLGSIPIDKMRPTISALLTLALFGEASLVSASGGDHAFEWAGTFDVSDYDSVYWVAQKVDGDYADPTMDIVVMSTTSASEKALEDAEEIADPLLGGDSCTSWTGASALTPSSNSCYNLVFASTAFETIYEIHTAGLDYLAIFAEHFPTAFERTTHYLISSDGDDVEPVHELPHEEENKVLHSFLPTSLLFSAVCLLPACLLPRGRSLTNISSRPFSLLHSFSPASV